MTAVDSSLSTLRAAQAAILAYQGGPMAISAVPGAGKTFILERLVARLIQDLEVPPHRILVLTYMRGAARNFRERIQRHLRAQGRIAYGMQVMTIHAFCLGILRRHGARSEHPDSGEGALGILCEAEQAQIVRQGLDHYLEDPASRRRWEREHPADGDADPRQEAVDRLLRLIGVAKRRMLTPDDVESAVREQPELAFVYRFYLEEAARRRQIDFDDQLQRAVRLLCEDPSVRSFYQRRIRYVLEDEAQDSTAIQHELLRLLTDPEFGGAGNLVRVGDANQAILAFAGSDPRYFRDFCQSKETDGRRMPMPESGRSGRPIIDLANMLVEFSGRHPDPVVRRAFDGPLIAEVTSGAHRNPPIEACGVAWESYDGKEVELLSVCSQVRAYLREHPAAKAAVLCRTNRQVRDYTTCLERLFAGEPGRIFRDAAATDNSGEWLSLLECAVRLLAVDEAEPASTLVELVLAYCAAHRQLLVHHEALRRFVLQHGARAFLYPPFGLPPALAAGVHPADYDVLLGVAARLQRLLGIRHLPPLELLPTVARELLPADQLPLAAKVAQTVRVRLTRLPFDPMDVESAWIVQSPPLTTVAEVLRALVEGGSKAFGDRRRFLEPPQELVPQEPGQVAVLTMHHSKGSEYHAIWIPNLGGFSGKRQDGRWGKAFPWSVQEVREDDQRDFAARHALEAFPDVPNIAALREEAARGAVAEGLRLLYVGITRAQHHLFLSSSGKFHELPPHIQELARACRP